MGGKSSEREVSLASGTNIAEALASLGKYEVVPIDLTEENLNQLPDGVDAVYIALHGGWGEDGGVQAALNARKIPYTGPGVKASQIAMDKLKTKLVLEMKNVPTAKWDLAHPDTPKSPLPLPVVVKPPSDGSSVGISKVASDDQWAGALAAAYAVTSMSEDAAGETHRDTEASDATDPEPSRDVTQEDLSVRLEQAAELWNTRVALARTQWKGRLAIRDEATSAAFDAALDEMNGRLRDSMAALAEEIAAAGKMNAELGLRLMGDLSRTMAETYDTIGAALPEDRRAEVAEMPVYEFIDPMVAEPLIGVQDLLKEDPRWSPRR